jgi:hypothetical protein
LGLYHDDLASDAQIGLNTVCFRFFKQALRNDFGVLHVVPIAPNGTTFGFTQRQIDCLAEAGVEGRMVFFGGSAMLLRPHRLLIGIAAIRREIRIFKPTIVHAHWGSLLALATTIASLGARRL